MSHSWIGVAIKPDESINPKDRWAIRAGSKNVYSPRAQSTSPEGATMMEDALESSRGASSPLGKKGEENTCDSSLSEELDDQEWHSAEGEGN